MEIRNDCGGFPKRLRSFSETTAVVSGKDALRFSVGKEKKRFGTPQVGARQIFYRALG